MRIQSSRLNRSVISGLSIWTAVRNRWVGSEPLTNNTSAGSYNNQSHSTNKYAISEVYNNINTSSAYSQIFSPAPPTDSHIINSAENLTKIKAQARFLHHWGPQHSFGSNRTRQPVKQKVKVVPVSKVTNCHLLHRNLVVLCQTLKIFYHILTFCKDLARRTVTYNKNNLLQVLWQCINALKFCSVQLAIIPVHNWA